MVPVLLSDILEHCSSKDNKVRTAGLYALMTLLGCGTGQLREAAAREVLSLMKNQIVDMESVKECCSMPEAQLPSFEHSSAARMCRADIEVLCVTTGGETASGGHLRTAKLLES